MNCPECGAWTTISETRLTVMRYRRRRECGNGHKFTTEEVVVSKEQLDAESNERLRVFREKELKRVTTKKTQSNCNNFSTTKELST
jgi:transcriptional regulator NrdR family protein